MIKRVPACNITFLSLIFFAVLMLGPGVGKVNGANRFSGASAKTTTGATVTGILSIEGTASICGTAPAWSGTAYTLQYKTTDAHTAGTLWIMPFVGTGGAIVANTAGSVTMNGAETFSTGVPLTINSGATLNSSTYSNTFSATLVVTITGTFQTANTTGFSGAAGTEISSTNAPTITLGGEVLPLNILWQLAGKPYQEGLTNQNRSKATSTRYYL